MAEPLLLVEQVVKEYGERLRTRALAGVDLTLARGELVALVGPSGSGKSTLLNIIGLLDRPTSGRVLLDGTETEGLDDRALTRLRAQRLGFIFQFHHLLPAFSALENVMLPGWGEAGVASRQLRTDAEQLLRDVGLGDCLRYKPSELSGGQQQRVAVARALCRRPPLILADEPTGNLDSESADEIFALMRKFNRELAVSFLIVTHDPRIAERCDRTIEIIDGRVRPRGPTPSTPPAAP